MQRRIQGVLWGLSPPPGKRKNLSHPPGQIPEYAGFMSYDRTYKQTCRDYYFYDIGL